jgi:O6-methylguanine-DNA--protein-cysteine methyltransferase
VLEVEAVGTGTPVEGVCAAAADQHVIAVAALEVVGAGVAGTSVAERLAARGWQVSLIDEAEVQIMEYLAGRRTIFELPIRLHGTDFQRHVWHVLTDINYGCATTYGMLALMARCEGGSRAVGSAVKSESSDGFQHFQIRAAGRMLQCETRDTRVLCECL